MQNSLKVLLVEDNESDGALVIRQLQKANYEVIFKRVESQAEMAVALEQEEWDIVISDFSLPQFTAHDSLKVLQDSGKDIPFIVVSGTIGETTAVVMMKSGAQDYLMKDNLIRLAPAVGREIADAQVRRERKRASAAQIESEAKFRAVWENSTDAIGVAIHGRHEFVNPAYVALFAYESQDELINTSILNLVSTGERARIEGYIEKRTVQSSVPFEYETIGLKKDGTTFNMDVKLSLFNYNNEQHVLIILRDITERKRTEERLKEELAIRTAAEKRAEESNMVKSSLMMNMSHEVRTPLNAILGFSSIISNESAEEDIRHMAERIRTSGDRLLKTLDDILKLTQLQTGSEPLSLVVCGLEPSISGIIEKVLPMAEQKRLSLSYNPIHPVIAAVDMRLFEKAMGELLNNAIKFTDRGLVTVESDHVLAGSRPMIEIRITDTGIGIAPEYHQVIFESFRQVSGGYSRSYEGTGLGLTIARKIIELFNGELLLESEIGQGSVFIIRLPEAGPQPQIVEKPFIAEALPAKTKQPATAAKKIKTLILLVEDNEDNVFLTNEFCKDDYEIDAALNGRDAIEKAREKSYDVILMDINLGLGINGLEAASEIKKLETNHLTPIIAMTGFTFKVDQKRILENGCDYYLGKPFSRKEILNILATVIH